MLGKLGPEQPHRGFRQSVVVGVPLRADRWLRADLLQPLGVRMARYWAPVRVVDQTLELGAPRAQEEAKPDRFGRFLSSSDLRRCL